MLVDGKAARRGGLRVYLLFHGLLLTLGCWF